MSKIALYAILSGFSGKNISIYLDSIFKARKFKLKKIVLEKKLKQKNINEKKHKASNISSLKIINSKKHNKT